MEIVLSVLAIILLIIIFSVVSVKRDEKIKKQILENLNYEWVNTENVRKKITIGGVNFYQLIGVLERDGLIETNHNPQKSFGITIKPNQIRKVPQKN